jgi:hypothetical protein
MEWAEVISLAEIEEAAYVAEDDELIHDDDDWSKT